jgi:hypothetical protein
MKNTLLISSFIILASFTIFSCQKDETLNTNTKNYPKIKEAVTNSNSYTVKMYANDSLFVGYNKLFFKVLKSNGGQTVSQATLKLLPLMDMVTFSHACPVENPSGTLNADGYFEGAVLFSMPGTDSWTLDVPVEAEGIRDTAHFDLHQVIATSPVRKIVAIDSLSNGSGGWIITKYPISLVLPDAWKVGNNKFEITIHRMASMMDFPAVTDLTVEITPEMPSMGHGSPNNVNPVHTTNGHYVGTVNYTMTGDWRIHLTIKKGDRLITSRMYFDIFF